MSFMFIRILLLADCFFWLDTIDSGRIEVGCSAKFAFGFVRCFVRSKRGGEGGEM